MDIRRILPHREPFLFVDRADEVEISSTSPVGDRIVAYKNVSAEEPFFKGHFPGRPVMPGVLLLEAMSQAGMLVVYGSKNWDQSTQKLFYLSSVLRAKFRKPVLPGASLKLEATIKSVRQNKFWTLSTKAYIVEGGAETLATEAEVMGAVV